MKRDSKRFKLLLALHKYLGLATGVIVLLVSLTGAGWVFRDEVLALTEPELTTVMAPGETALPASVARAIGERLFPGRTIHGTHYGAADEPVEIVFYDYAPRFYRSVFVHPATGEVLHVRDHLSGYFAWMLRGHMYLWLPPGLGGPVVKYGILLFLFIALSGLVIRAKGRWKNAGRNLTFRWKPSTGWKRKNYDLHSVVGTYVYVFAFLFAFTGSVIGLPWFYQLTYRLAGGEGNPDFHVPANRSAGPARVAADGSPAYDLLVPRLRAEVPEATGFELHYPHADRLSVYVEVMRGKGTQYANDYRYFDRHSLEEIPSASVYATYADADFAKVIMRMNYDLHVGAIGGLAGKVLAFFASLLIATLPVTGYLLYYGRRQKSSKRARPPVPGTVGKRRGRGQRVRV